MNKNIPRGIRNNNPGNIRYDGTKWMGLAMPPSDGAFCRFESALFGIRAIAKILVTYNKKYGLCTIGQIISRWAPPNENDTNAYISHICRAVGAGADDQLDLADPGIILPLCRAIIRHENGACPYSDEEIKKGIAL